MRWLIHHRMGVATLLGLVLAAIPILWELCPKTPQHELAYRVGDFLCLVEECDIEIQNIGTDPIWYNSRDDRPAEASLVYIETTPPMAILDANVVKGDVSDNGFRLMKNSEWDRGRIECRWRRLSSGESVIIRVAYWKTEGRPDIRLTGELEDCLVPTRLEPYRGQMGTAKILAYATFFFVCALAGLFLVRPCLVAWRKRERDRKMLRALRLPLGVAPSLLAYWRGELVGRACRLV